jgi:ferredoxin
MRIEVDEHRCVGAGRCAWVAPGVFTQRASDGVVVLLQAEPSAADEPFAREAAELCPARAIAIRDTPAAPTAGPTEET